MLYKGSTKAKKGFGEIYEDCNGTGTLMYNNLKINRRMYTLEQLGEEEQARKEVREQPNMTSNPKRTASDRSPHGKGKEEKMGRACKMKRNITNTDRTSKDRDIRGI